MATSIRPLNDRILVKRDDGVSKTTSGLFLPESSQDKQTKGRVIAVGQGKVLEGGSLRELAVKTGDRVMFGKYSGTEIQVDGVEHLMLREDDILGIVED